MDDSGTVAIGGRVFNVVAFAGSLRRASYNRAPLRGDGTRAVSAKYHGARVGRYSLVQRGRDLSTTLTDLIPLHVLADLAGRSARQASANAH